MLCYGSEAMIRCRFVSSVRTHPFKLIMTEWKSLLVSPMMILNDLFSYTKYHNFGF